MAQGSKDRYTDKQKRQAKAIAEGYQRRGVSKKTAKARAWATVNKQSGGGNLSGSGRGRPDNQASARKGGRLGGKKAGKKKAGKTTAKRASEAGGQRTAAQRSAAAKKGWETRRRRAGES